MGLTASRASSQQLEFQALHTIESLFPGSSHVRLLGLEHASDGEIWDYAKANEYTLVPLDADFVDIATLVGPPPKVIRLRCGNSATRMVEALLRDHADLIVEFGQGDSACLEIY